MRIKLNLNETSTAGSVYSTPSMESAEQQEPSDEELAIRDTEEKEREAQEAEKARKDAAKKAAEDAKKVPKTPKESGEDASGDTGDGDDDDSGGEDDASDDSDDSADDETSDDESADDEEDLGDEEEDEGDEEEEEEDEEATASALPYPDAQKAVPDLPILPLKEVPADPEAEEENLNADDNTASNLKNTPDDPNVKDGDNKIEATIEAVASAYSERQAIRSALPYPDAWKA
jgi:hypothetical protein